MNDHPLLSSVTTAELYVRVGAGGVDEKKKHEQTDRCSTDFQPTTTDVQPTFNPLSTDFNPLSTDVPVHRLLFTDLAGFQTDF